MTKRFNSLPRIKQFAILLAALMLLRGIVWLRYTDDKRQQLADEIAELASEATQEPERINRVDIIAANRPEDWQPTLVYSDPGKIYYPEVIEAQKKKAKQAENRRLETWRAYHEDGILIDYEELK